MTIDEVVDEVIIELMAEPASLSELDEQFEFKIPVMDLEEALDILWETGAINDRQEPRKEGLVAVYEFRKEYLLRTVMKEYKKVHK